MDWHDIALGGAGVLGASVAILHGVLTQRLMIRPLEAVYADDRRIPGPIRKVVPLLLHFSTFNWFLGGLALIAATGLAPGARLAIAVLVGASYLFGALGNLWATRFRHPGGWLYAAAVAMIALGAWKP